MVVAVLGKQCERGLEAPVQGLFRTATTDSVVSGVPIPRGSMLWLVFGSANHANATFVEPDRLDLERPSGRPHLAFGRGEHFCLGASIARLEARVGMELLLDRFDSLELQEPTDPPMHPSFVLHGLRELPVKFRAT